MHRLCVEFGPPSPDPPQDPLGEGTQDQNKNYGRRETFRPPPQQFEDVRPGRDPDKKQILELSVKTPTPENDDFMFGHVVLVFGESRAGEISLQVGFEKM